MIPDKLYFPEYGLPRYIDWDGSPIRTKQVEDSDICYIRKDTLLEFLDFMKDYHSGVYISADVLNAIERLKEKINSL